MLGATISCVPICFSAHVKIQTHYLVGEASIPGILLIGDRIPCRVPIPLPPPPVTLFSELVQIFLGYIDPVNIIVYNKYMYLSGWPN